VISILVLGNNMNTIKKNKVLVNIRPVNSKDIAGAGLTLSMGYLIGPFIPFKELKDWRFKLRKAKGGSK